VSIVDYYYDGRTKSIEKRSNKRKRGESAKSRSSTGKVLEWKVGLDLEENFFQAAYSLHEFSILNSSYVLEVTNGLSTTRNRITKLEAELKIVKDNLTVEFEEATRVVATLIKENLNTALQMQKDEMNLEYERRAQTQQDTHVRELECVKLKFGDEIEQLKKEHIGEAAKMKMELT
jgi:hypothetical protein